MEKIISFYNKEGCLTIDMNQAVSFDVLMMTLKNKLESLYVKKDLLKSNVIIDFHDRELDNKQILKLFDLFASFEYLKIKGIMSKKSNNMELVLHEGSIRSGEIKFFRTNTLLIGNINQGAKVIVNGNIYVIGQIKGTIELRYLHNKLISSKVENSTIKIGKYEKIVSEELENSEFFYENNEIKVVSSIKGRVKQDGKSNSNYLW